MIPNKFEIQVLKMINGDIPWEKGSWVNACFEFLQEGGYVTRLNELSQKGKDYLRQLDYNEQAKTTV